MISLSFTPSDVEVLREQRYAHPHPHVQRKMEALLLKRYGLPHELIADIVDVCPNTLRSYFDDFLSGGTNRLFEIRFYKPTSDLVPFTGTLEDHFRQCPVATIKEAAARIEEITGIKRGLTQVRKFILSLGLQLRKTGFIPAKADVEKQKMFLEKELEPRLKEAREGKRKLFFVDAAHFVFAPFLGFLWCFARVFVRAPSGRMRFNVLGALNAVSHELVAFTNETYINAISVCSLLSKIAASAVPDIPITLVLDNARYQKCILVQAQAQKLNIELLYLPTYSPNLNLIERLWKFTKHRCLNSKYYSDFACFRGAITGFLDSVHQLHKKDLDTLLTHRFQHFEKTQPMLKAA